MRVIRSKISLMCSIDVAVVSDSRRAAPPISVFVKLIACVLMVAKLIWYFCASSRYAKN